MEDLQKLLREHQRLYPQLTEVDLVKLVYQNEFGSGHFVSNEEASLARLEKEVSELQTAEGHLFESIGNGLARLHLRILGQALPLRTVNRFFVLTAARKQGSVEGFEVKLQLLRELYPGGALESFLEEYKKAGYPPMSHSDRYKEHYAPSYRVVSSDFALYFPVFRDIEKLLEQKESVIVAIDGRSGSGKSTLAELLHHVYGCPVISMDHFFLRPAQRTEERLQEPGGNVDYERFGSEVILKLQEREPFTYQIYNCQTGKFTPSPTIEPHPLIVVEGSYSHHPTLAKEYDFRVFLTISLEGQRERIFKRNGPAIAQRFFGEWIPLEELYFSTLKIREKSDLALETEGDKYRP